MRRSGVRLSSRARRGLDEETSELHRGTVDLSYVLTARVSVRVSYRYEQYRVRDFTLDIDGNFDLVRGQAVVLGYLYKRYTPNVGWLRLLYRW